MNIANNTKEMVCITCPMGCHLEIEQTSGGGISVTGNRCARGEQYAREEILSPRRVVTATCRVRGSGSGSLYAPRRVPLRTRSAFPRERIAELLSLVYAMDLGLPVERGQVAIADVLGTGIDLIVERTMPADR